MKYKTGNNNYDLCSSMDASELVSSVTCKCANSSGTRTYTMTESKKTAIVEGLKRNGINTYHVSWIGEKRTKLRDGTLKSFGYSSFVNED